MSQSPLGSATLEKRLAPFADVAPDVVVIARFSPGLRRDNDLSSWRLTLNLAGILIQEIEISNQANNHAREAKREVVDVGSDFVASVLAYADELDYWNLKIDSNATVEGAPSLELSVRSGYQMRAWEPEAVHYHANRYENLSARKFIALWKLVHQHAPFPKRDSR